MAKPPVIRVLIPQAVEAAKRIAHSAPQNAKSTSGFNPLTSCAMLLPVPPAPAAKPVLLVLYGAKFGPAAPTSESR